MVNQKSSILKPSIAQLEERGTVTDTCHPEVAGSNPARRTTFFDGAGKRSFGRVVVLIVIAVTD